LTLLAAAIVCKAIIATDEWPLRLVVGDLMTDPDEDGDDYGIGLMSSLELLALLENQGFLTKDKRIVTVEAWQRHGKIFPKIGRPNTSAFSENAPRFQTINPAIKYLPTERTEHARA
jgi:hypothetical protein